MSCFAVTGGKKLSGEVTIQGAKNSVLPILAATLLSRGQCVLENCPRLRDVMASIQILQSLGCRTWWQGNALSVDTTYISGAVIPDTLMREMRSSAIFLGAMLARCGEAELSYPGGCELGPRPIDLHLGGLRQLGADIEEEGGRLRCKSAKLRGCDIALSLPSVGATENLMLAACGAEGTTRILHAAREPEIVELQAFLRLCGAEVSGAGSDCVVIRGGKPLHGCSHRVRADRIVTATYLCGAAAAGGEVFLRQARADDLTAVVTVLREAGCEIRKDAAGIFCGRKGKLRAVSTVRTAPYPGFPTDAQSVLMAALLCGEGTTVFEENIFENRYRHVSELCRMGGDIRVLGRVAVVNGVRHLHGAAVESTDLRGGAALCVAGLSAEGRTQVGGIHHIQRGYADLPGDLRALGADVVQEDE
ncbi:MAG: UDP-N-acetylglucosamine 1-carboxyvinyltransferase [Ruminococcaceae bacterium]|nr:UDP-N-acetylglucosamine 1-carboxyvinyltransferase [Oscillospiraceae bacterium]